MPTNLVLCLCIGIYGYHVTKYCLLDILYADIMSPWRLGDYDHVNIARLDHVLTVFSLGFISYVLHLIVKFLANFGSESLTMIASVLFYSCMFPLNECFASVACLM